MPPAQERGLPATIVLAIGQSARIEGTPLSIALEAIENDSRCPEGVQCVWAGDVSARIRIEGNGNAQTVALNLNRNSTNIVHGDHRITLTAVTPTPKATEKIDPKSYRASFRIESSPRGRV